jgi:thiamine-phosphate diphosphorylase
MTLKVAPKIKLYCFTVDRQDITLEEQAEKACQGGADAIEFQCAAFSAKDALLHGERLRDVCRELKALFFISSRPDIALALDADGVALRTDDIPLITARQILGPRKQVLASISSLGQAMQAAQDGADYLMVGPIYPEGQVTDKESRGVDVIRMVKKRVQIPVIAFGGITAANVAEVIETGADGAAAARAVCGAKDIRQAAVDMKQRIAQANDNRKTGTGNDAY